MHLYTTPASPWVRKCIVTIVELGIEDRVEFKPTRWPHRWATQTVEFDPSFAAATPVARIPALVVEDGTRLTDSGTICDYLNETFGGGRLLPRDDPDHWRLRSIISITNSLIEAQIARRAETLRPRHERSADFIAKMHAREMRCYEALGEMVHAFKSDFDLAQLSVAVACDYSDFRFQDDWRAAAPALVPWFERFLSRPSMQRTRPSETPE